MKQNKDGVHFAWKKQSKSWFFFQKWPHTSAEGSINAQFVAKLVGCKVKDPLQKAFIENFSRSKENFCKKLLD